MAGLSWFQTRHVKRTFLTFAGKDKLLDPAEWREACGIRNSNIATRLFQLIDTDGSGFIDIKEFVQFIRTIRHPKIEVRLEFLFQIYDGDNDGLLERAELRSILESSLSEQGLRVDDQDLKLLVNALIKKMDVDKDKVVSKDDFVNFTSQLEDIELQFDGFFTRWAPKYKLRKKSAANYQPSAMTKLVNWMGFNWQSQFWLLVYATINTVLFYKTMLAYAHAPLAIQIARGAAACVYLNSALVLLPTCKALWHGLRHTFLNRLLPLDQLNAFHKWVGSAIVLFSIVHIAGHVTNYTHQNADLTYELLFSKIGQSGTILTLTLCVLLYGIYKRSSSRWAFSFTHVLSAAYIIVLLMHGVYFWIWFLVPGLLYLVDALLRAFLKTRAVTLESVAPLSDGVTSLFFKKPRFMNFYPGDYVYVRIPNLAWSEWHPFTISAAPETASLAIHVRNNGDWSGALYNYSRSKLENKKPLKVYIDGPYGTPTSGIYRSQVAILVAAGIGVTPFASALQSVLLRDRSKDEVTAAEQVLLFHWLNRSQRSYEWFTDLLTKAEQQLGSKNFQLNIHLTSLSHNLTNIAMQVAISAFREAHNRDPLTNLQAVTTAGRPDWDEVLAKANQQYPDRRIDLYFCGPTALGKDLRKACRRHGIAFHQEQFD